MRRLRSLFDHELCAHCRLRRPAIRALGDRPYVPAVAPRQQSAGAPRLPPTTGKFDSGLAHTRSEDALCALEKLELICLCIRRGHPDERRPRNFRRVNRSGRLGCRRGADGIVRRGRRGRSRLGGCADRWGDGGCDRLSPLRTSAGETLTTDEQRKQNAERKHPGSGREQTNSDAAARRWELHSPLETARQALDQADEGGCAATGTGRGGSGSRSRAARASSGSTIASSGLTGSEGLAGSTEDDSWRSGTTLPPAVISSAPACGRCPPSRTYQPRSPRRAGSLRPSARSSLSSAHPFFPGVRHRGLLQTAIGGGQSAVSWSTQRIVPGAGRITPHPGPQRRCLSHVALVLRQW